MLTRRRRRSRVIPVIKAVLAILAVLLIAVAGYLASTLTLTLQLSGEPGITQEYSGTYTEPGANAWIKTPVFPEFSAEIPVQVTGKVDQHRVGSYVLSYHAEYLWLNDQATRLIQIVDTQPPELTLTEIEGDDTLPGNVYQEVGFRAYDDYDGDITHLVSRIERENVITYFVKDSSGNHAIAHRVVNFTDPVPPELTLAGEETVTIFYGQSYQEPGFQAVDNLDGDITSRVQVSGSVDGNTLGTYTIHYCVSDAFGNTVSAQRTVIVAPNPEVIPVIPGEKTIYLTFDDGPTEHTPRLLEVLKKYNVKATFFVVSNRYANTITEIAAQGHSVGIHTASHVYSEIYASEEAYFKDFQKIYDLVYEKTGVKTTLMRFPGGGSNTISSHYNQGIMTRLTKMVTDRGMQYFDWNVDSRDAAGAKSADEVYWNVIKGVSNKPCAIVLQHDIAGFSVDAVERIIQWGLANGYTFLPLDPTSPNCHHQVQN